MEIADAGEAGGGVLDVSPLAGADALIEEAASPTVTMKPTATRV